MKFVKNKKYLNSDCEGEWIYVAEDKNQIVMRNSGTGLIKSFDLYTQSWSLSPVPLSNRMKSFNTAINRYSHTCPSDRVKQFLKKYKLKIVEDD